MEPLAPFLFPKHLFQTLHKPTVFDQTHDVIGNFTALILFVLCFIINDAIGCIDTENVVSIDFIGFGTLKQQQADVDGISIEDSCEVFGNHRSRTLVAQRQR